LPDCVHPSTVGSSESFRRDLKTHQFGLHALQTAQCLTCSSSRIVYALGHTLTSFCSVCHSRGCFSHNHVFALQKWAFT